MIIEKIINNNILSSIDKDGSEIIVTGRGIGFKRKAGEEIDEALIEKTYKMKSKSEGNKLQELIADIPLEQIDVCSELIDYYKNKLKVGLNESIMVTLTDHISFAIERSKNGNTYANKILTEIRQFYPEEYELGLYSIDYIDKKLDIRLSKDEAGFIAMHIINAELDTKMSEVYQITQFIESIVKLVETYYGKSFNRNSVYYDRFVVHLKYFGQRIFSEKGIEFTNGSKEFQDMIKKSCPTATDCAMKIADYCRNLYNIELDDEELMYLTIHLKRISIKD